MNPQTDTPESAEAANFSVSFALNRLKSLADEIADNGNDESWPREIRVAVENIKDARAILTAQQSDTALKLQRCEAALETCAYVMGHARSYLPQSGVFAQPRLDDFDEAIKAARAACKGGDAV